MGQSAPRDYLRAVIARQLGGIAVSTGEFGEDAGGGPLDARTRDLDRRDGLAPSALQTVTWAKLQAPASMPSASHMMKATDSARGSPRGPYALPVRVKSGAGLPC